LFLVVEIIHIPTLLIKLNCLNKQIKSNQKQSTNLKNLNPLSNMKSVAATTTLLALLGSTTAFAPVSQRSNSAVVTTALSAALIDDMVGALDPVGLFDPLGFAEKADDNTLKRYREAELTHGRVAMLAVVGFLVGEQVEGSSFLFDSQITGPAITHLAQVP
jgi:hypothetical protein